MVRRMSEEDSSELEVTGIATGLGRDQPRGVLDAATAGLQAPQAAYRAGSMLRWC